MPRSEITATIYDSTASIPVTIWEAMLSGDKKKPGNPFLSHAFFLALETSGSAIPETGWHPQHIVITQEERPVGLLPLFIKPHSQGEYVFDHAWADAMERAGGSYYPKLQASIPFTPVTSPKLLVPSDSLELKSSLLDTARQLATHHKASSVHATFIMEDEEIIGQENNWLTRHDTQFHWQNRNFETFDAFLATLSSRKRKNIRTERRKAMAGELKIDWIKGEEITEAQWDQFFVFYQDTGARKWGHPYLTREFFSLLSQNMPNQIVLMMARIGDVYIAGTLNFFSNDTLYGRYWGCSRDIAFLHFELCYYQAIEYAIAHKLKTVEAGAQGEHKLARGYEPTLTRSIHWIENPGLRRAVEDYLHHERAAVTQDQTALTHAGPFKNSI